jgi:hypothetical protein
MFTVIGMNLEIWRISRTEKNGLDINRETIKYAYLCQFHNMEIDKLLLHVLNQLKIF